MKEQVPQGYELVMVPKLQPADEPDWDDCIRQAEIATGLKVERHTLSIVIREVRRWLAGRSRGATEREQIAAYIEAEARWEHCDCGCPSERTPATAMDVRLVRLAAEIRMGKHARGVQEWGK